MTTAFHSGLQGSRRAALGDAVNVASRLQSYAAVGEVVLAAELYELIEQEHPGAERRRVEVRGREEPMDIAVLST